MPILIASLGDDADSTLKPAFVRINETPARRTGVSSTTRIVSATIVLVQREMESSRFPVSEYTRSFDGRVGRTSRGKWRLVNGRRLKLQLVSTRKRHVGWSALTKPPCVEERNWLG